jgi:hypothetical protein
VHPHGGPSIRRASKRANRSTGGRIQTHNRQRIAHGTVRRPTDSTPTSRCPWQQQHRPQKKKKKEGMHARVRHHHRSAVKRKRGEVQFCLFMLRNCSHQFRPIPSPTHLPLLASPVTSGEIYSHQPPANTTNASTKCHRLKSARSVS